MSTRASGVKNEGARRRNKSTKLQNSSSVSDIKELFNKQQIQTEKEKKTEKPVEGEENQERNQEAGEEKENEIAFKARRSVTNSSTQRVTLRSDNHDKSSSSPVTSVFDSDSEGSQSTSLDANEEEREELNDGETGDYEIDEEQREKLQVSFSSEAEQELETTVIDTSIGQLTAEVSPNNAVENNGKLPQEKKTQQGTLNSQETLTQILDALKALKTSVDKLDNDIHHPQSGIGAQMVKMTLRMDNLYTDIHGAVSGIIPRTGKLENQQLINCNKITELEKKQGRLTKLVNDSKRLTSDITLLQGIIQKHSQQVLQLENKATDLIRRSMEQNLLIFGIDNPVIDTDGKTELYKHSTLQFLKEQLNVDLAIEDVWKAHRTGKRLSDRTQPMVVKLSYSAKELVMENVAALKDKVDKYGKALFIKEQIPEAFVEKKKQISARLKTLRDLNEQKPSQERQEITVNNDNILVDGKVDLLEVLTPQPIDLFLNDVEQIEVDKIAEKIQQTEIQEVRNSQFIGHAIKVHSTQQVNRAYIALAQRYSAMDHIFMAYALKEGDKVKNGHCDDREHAGGNTIRKILLRDRIKNTAVFIVRKFGGIHLGLERFKVFEAITQSSIKLVNVEYEPGQWEEVRRRGTNTKTRGRGSTSTVRGRGRGGIAPH